MANVDSLTTDETLSELNSLTANPATFTPETLTQALTVLETEATSATATVAQIESSLDICSNLLSVETDALS